MNVPDAVRQLRTALGQITQQDLAVRLGLAVTSVSRYENGSSTPAAGVLRQLVNLAREGGRDDLARVFVFGTDETAELGAIGREMLFDVDQHYLETAHRYAAELALICGASGDPHAAQLARKLEMTLRQIEVTIGITGRTLTLDEARQVQALANYSLDRGR